MENIEITDRYSATGTPRPEPETVCEGDCDGMGYYPENKESLNIEAVKVKGGSLLIVGQVNDDKTPTEEDSHVFVMCPECCGSRLKEPAKTLKYGGYEWQRVEK